ncbi:MCE family protein [Candidatus Protofrankia datiscae]|uniref:MCE family protein n=2 Tax=Candidatus Protofrankia datiscae TaxID=2716812 RepID=UPI000A01679A|nr:MCE family protein [Candidatus Protofrankia datiscae]
MVRTVHESGNPPVFDRLDDVLRVLQPAKVNAALGAVSQAVAGRGEEIGRTIDVTNSYLGKINNDIPQLTRDLDKGATVLDIYAAATPDLMRVLANGTVTARTFVDQQGAFHGLLQQLSSLSGTGQDFLAINGSRLVDLAHSLIPITSLLEDYSPEFSCFLQGADKAHQLLKTAIGGVVPGVMAIVSIQPGNEPYQYPRDLPNIAADNGPNCHGMPDYDGSYIPASLMVPVDKGGDPNPPGPDANRARLAQTPLVVRLFGPLATLGSTPATTSPATPAGTTTAAGGRR